MVNAGVMLNTTIVQWAENMLLSGERDAEGLDHSSRKIINKRIKRNTIKKYDHLQYISIYKSSLYRVNYVGSKMC